MIAAARMHVVIGASLKDGVDAARASRGRLLRRLPFAARDDVGGVQSDQWCFGAVGSYWPCPFSASFSSSVRVATSRLLNPRPGSRVVISWSSQLLPSGSLNVAWVL